MSSVVFWVVNLRSGVNNSLSFRGTFRLHPTIKIQALSYVTLKCW
jgi:hypothetical protein